MREMVQAVRRMIDAGEQLETKLTVRGSRLIAMQVRVTMDELEGFVQVGNALGVSMPDVVRALIRDGSRARYKSGRWLVDPELQRALLGCPPMPEPDRVEPEYDGVKLGDVGLLSCVTEPRGRRYHLTRSFLYMILGETVASRLVLDGYVGTTPRGAVTYAMGIARVTDLNANGLVSVERLPDEFVFSWLDTRAHGRLRRGYSLYDKDWQARLIKDRGASLDLFLPVDPTCRTCVRWHRFMKSRLERAEREGLYRLRLSKPCLKHGRCDVCTKYVRDKVRTVDTACARSDLGIGPGGRALPDHWDGLPPSQRSIEYEDVTNDDC